MTLAPISASLRAITEPSPRPDPVTNAVLPLSSCIQFRLPLSQKSQRPQVLGAFAHLCQFEVDQAVAILPGFPRRAVIGVVGQPVALRGQQRRRQRLGLFGRITLPPVAREQPDMARLERADLDGGGQRAMMRAEDFEHFSQRHGAIAGSAAHQPQPFRR